MTDGEKMIWATAYNHAFTSQLVNLNASAKTSVTKAVQFATNVIYNIRRYDYSTSNGNGKDTLEKETIEMLNAMLN